MPSIAENKRLVEDSLKAGPDHDAILASLQHEIDKHNQLKSDTEKHFRRRRHRDKQASDLRFRFKDGKEASRRRRRKCTRSPSQARDEPEAEHPFPRELTSPSATPAEGAFLSSLLDALADDEAAAYWESVYSQPIHAFARPSVRTEKGELEQMSDEDYAAWVKQKMWEKQHPEVVMEQDKMARKREEEAAQKRRRKEEFVKRRQTEAWSRASRHKDDDRTEQYEPVVEKNVEFSSPKASEEWRQAWTEYLQRWEKLKTAPDVDSPSTILPWPTLPSQPPIRPNIEAFLRNMPLQNGKNRQAVLKAERVRWHPDKIQQRFQGKVDTGTMQVVTGIFQIIDGIWNEEQQK